MIQTEYRLVSVGVSVGPAYFPSKTKKESETLSETDGLCSSEHGFWGIGRFCKLPQSLLATSYSGSSTNFVGYSYILSLIGWF